MEGFNPGEPEIADGRVRGVLARLNERDREALTLVAWDGLTPEPPRHDHAPAGGPS